MDVDIVYASDQNNTESIVDALVQIDAHYRHQGDHKLAPTTSGLSSTQAAGHHLLETRLGNLDLLRTVAGLGYEDLCGEAISIEIDGTTSSFSPLSRIIALKEAAGRPKDIAALPTLRAALLDSGDS